LLFVCLFRGISGRQFLVNVSSTVARKTLPARKFYG
jgi:hypothetical protein